MASIDIRGAHGKGVYDGKDAIQLGPYGENAGAAENGVGGGIAFLRLSHVLKSPSSPIYFFC